MTADDTVDVSGLTPITFGFTEKGMANLEALKQRTEKTSGSIIAHALALEEWYADVRDSRGRIFVKWPDGTVKEVLGFE